MFMTNVIIQILEVQTNKSFLVFGFSTVILGFTNSVGSATGTITSKSCMRCNSALNFSCIAIGNLRGG